MSPDLPPLAQRELDAIDAALAGRPVEDDLADVAELARALQADRPVPSPSFARELDERAAAGWRKAPARARPPRRRKLAALLRPQLGIAVAGLAAVGIGIAVIPGLQSGEDSGSLISSESSSSEGGSGGASTAAPSAPSPARRGSVEREDALQSDTPQTESRLAPPPNSQAPQDMGRAGKRFVERSAAMTLAMVPDELESVAAGVARVTERADGYVSRSAVTADPEGGSAEFVLRVPSARLNTVLAELSRLADVRSRTQGTDDITAAVSSTSERVGDLRAERAGLRRRLARTGDPAIRDRLRYVSAELARARGQLRNVRRRADLATVQVSLMGDVGAKAGGAAPDDGRWGPGDALRDAGRILEWVAGAALVGLAATLPLLLLLLPLLLAARWWRGRLRERTLDAV